MNGLIYNLINRIYNSIGADGIFLAIFVLLTVTAVVLIISARNNAEQVKKIKIFSALIFLGLILIHAGLELLLKSFTFTIISLGVAVIYLAIIYSIPPKKAKFTEKQLDLARLIDKKASDLKQEREVCEKIELKPVEENIRVEDKELDFSHVKSVINRMEYYSLGQNDKRQVYELEQALNEAEKNGLNDSIKNRINDGLGALLKIMSKYGI